MSSPKYKNLVEIGPGFWNLRGSFKFLWGIIDIKTHMSFAKLANGKFLVIDTIDLTPEKKADIDALTQNGSLIEAVVGTHPYHTVYFKPFHTAYPSAKFYGTPRHLRAIPEIPWAGDVNNADVRAKWEPEIFMRIPDGAEFVNPLPEKTNHFSNVFVFHPQSKTIHNDDTVLYADNPGWLLHFAGFKTGKLLFHPSLTGPGLKPDPKSPECFRLWVEKLIADWDFDNICTAHTGNKVGGAKAALKQLLADTLPTLEKLAKGKARSKDYKGWSSDDRDGCECG